MLPKPARIVPKEQRNYIAGTTDLAHVSFRSAAQITELKVLSFHGPYQPMVKLVKGLPRL
jgi:hypothetical protein